jgi:prepilin-type N-terminal cleavage/methylation domain-containing protein
MKIIYDKSKQNGFSLIELMVVVLILGLITIGLVTFFSGGIRSWISGQSQLQAQREARQAMDRIVKEIREGESYVIGGDSITVSYPASFSKDPVTYKLSGTEIERKVNSVSNSLIKNVKKFNLVAIDSSKVQIIMEIDVDNDSKPDITLNSDVNLRNYGLGPYNDK